MRTPLVTNAKLVAYAETTWETLLTSQGYLQKTTDGWTWQAALTWYPDLETKIAAIKNSARQGEH